jgi:hypothetical protein
MQFIVITKDEKFIDVAQYSNYERFQDEYLKEFAEDYIACNLDEMVRIDYHEGGEITITDDNIFISGDNGIIEFDWFYRSV